MKKISYFLQALPIYLSFYIFAALPLDLASNLGGFLAKKIGPLLAASRKAYRHVGQVFPNKNKKEIEVIIAGMWENLGRVMAEYPHLQQIGRERIIIRNKEIFDQAVAAGLGGVFIGGHLANWEINAPTLLEQFNIPLGVTYRAPNNPYVSKLLQRARSLKGRIPTFPKQRATGRELMGILKNKGFIGILIDQKYNEGISVPFFGIPAMTNPIAVKLAQKYNSPLIPVRNRRIKGAHFESIVYPPLTHSRGYKAIPAEEVLRDAHLLLEEWIAEDPAQWLWLHRRWNVKTS